MAMEQTDRDAAELLKEAHGLAHEMGYDIEGKSDASENDRKYAVVFARSRRALSGYGSIEETLAWLHALDCPF